MKQHTKYDQHWELSNDRKQHMAKEIAKLLAECSATVDDMFDIFQYVREYLIVRKLPETEDEWNEL